MYLYSKHFFSILGTLLNRKYQVYKKRITTCLCTIIVSTILLTFPSVKKRKTVCCTFKANKYTTKPMNM